MTEATHSAPLLVVSNYAETAHTWARRYLGGRAWRLVTRRQQVYGYAPGVQYVVVDEPESGRHSLTDVVEHLRICGGVEVNALQFMADAG